jgi:hypothetical protein
MNDERKALENALHQAMPGYLARTMDPLIDELVDAVRRDQAARDADVLRRMSLRSPDVAPPRGGTTSRIVYAGAADLIDPAGEGWGLNLPDHLKDDQPAG